MEDMYQTKVDLWVLLMVESDKVEKPGYKAKLHPALRPFNYGVVSQEYGGSSTGNSNKLSSTTIIR